MQIFKEENLKFFKNKTDTELTMYMNKGNMLAKIVYAKRKLGVIGDIYYDDGFICNLKLHNENYEENCLTIEEAFENYKKYKQENYILEGI